MLVFYTLYRIAQSSKAHGVSDGSQIEFYRPETVEHLQPYLIVLERSTTRSPRTAELRCPRLTASDTGEHGVLFAVSVMLYNLSDIHSVLLVRV